MSNDEVTIYEELSEERKQLQAEGLLPEWFTTAGWQMFKSKALYDAPNYKAQIQRICRTVASYTDDPSKWEPKFFEIIWNGWLALSSPVLTNTGTSRGCSVSCSGNYVPDSVEGFFDSIKETALLSKAGFGTSSYLSDIRPRGAPYAHGGKADGVLPVIGHHVATISHISQASARRGSWAGYLDIEHGDFWELTEFLKNNPDELNIGWNVRDSFIRKLDSGNEDALARYRRALKLKTQTGKGYFFFVDKVNRLSPQVYKDHGIKVRASNLCVTGETEVITGDGPKRIDEVRAGEDSYVLSKNLETGEEEMKRVTAWAQTGWADELIVIELDDGRVLKMTEDHQVWTKNRGYVRAGDLTEEDELDIR